MIRVLVADNSATDRALLVALLETDAQIQVVGQAKSGAEVVSLTKRLRPQVVTMSLLERSSNLTSHIDGLEATRLIMAESPTPIVVALNPAQEQSGQDAARELLAAGAVAALKRPSQVGEAKELLDTVKAMAEVKVVGHRLRTSPRLARRLLPNGPVGVVAIAASTGGPNALIRVLKPLPRDLPVPIVIVQHLASGFVGGFARWLDEHCEVDVKLVERSERLLPGRAYLANDGTHLKVSKAAAPAGSHQPHFSLQLSNGEPQEGFCPSASVLFESVAESFGPRSLAVILTGMGRDGVSGLRQVRAQGGRVIAQDRDTSVVFGMPCMAIEAGLADDILPVDAIADRILELVRPKEPR
jgi:two-component system chemotaxis response regulator CheB